MNINGISENTYISSKVTTATNKAADDSFEKRLQKAMDSGDDQQLKKVCKDFESIILNMMYKQMKATIPKSDLIEKSTATEIYESMLDDKLVEEAAKNGGIGLADMLYKQLSSRRK